MISNHSLAFSSRLGAAIDVAVHRVKGDAADLDSVTRVDQALASATPALQLYGLVQAGEIGYMDALHILERERNRPVISLIDEAERDRARIDAGTDYASEHRLRPMECGL